MPMTSFSVAAAAKRECDERIVRPAVVLGERAAVARHHPGGHRDVRVLGDHQRLVAGVLGAPGQLGGVHRLAGEEDREPDVH